MCSKISGFIIISFCQSVCNFNHCVPNICYSSVENILEASNALHFLTWKSNYLIFSKLIPNLPDFLISLKEQFGNITNLSIVVVAISQFLLVKILRSHHCKDSTLDPLEKISLDVRKNPQMLEELNMLLMMCSIFVGKKFSVKGNP